MSLHVAAAFFRRGLQEALSYRIAFALQLVLAVVSLAAFFYLARFVDSASPTGATPGGYISFGLVGLVLLNLQHALVSAYPVVVRGAQLAGTLEAMLATPTPTWQLLLFAPIFTFASSVLSAIALLVAGGLFFGISFAQTNVPSLLVVTPLCLVVFASIGFFGAALTMTLRRSDPISMLISGLSVLSGGVFYPTSVLPGWLRQLGELLPITHGLQLLRAAFFDNASLADIAPGLLRLGLLCAVTVPLGLLAFSAALRRARRDGSLSHY